MSEPPPHIDPDLIGNHEDPKAADRDREVARQILRRELDPNDPDVQRLASIELARGRGMPWATIAQLLSLPDKRTAKRLYRELQRRVHLRRALG